MKRAAALVVFAALAVTGCGARNGGGRGGSTITKQAEETSPSRAEHGDLDRPFGQR